MKKKKKPEKEIRILMLKVEAVAKFKNGKWVISSEMTLGDNKNGILDKKLLK